MEFSRQTSSIVQKVIEKNFPGEEPSTPITDVGDAGAGQEISREETQPEPQEPEADMDALMAELDSAPQKGDLITGRVVSTSKDGVMVDIGAKSDGLIPTHELDADDDLQAGDEVEVILLKPGNEENLALLSKRRADYEKNWQQLLEHYQSGTVLEAMVKDSVKGGLVVDLGVEGFVPASHVMTKRRDLRGFVGQILKFKIIDIDRKRNKLILSNRQAVDEERQLKRQETWANLEEGKILPGVVRRITDFGAFVDLGGIDGLLHVTDIAWRRLRHPPEALKAGEKIDVLVLEIDQEREKISLGLKQLLPDPWKKAARNYRTGKVVKGTVTRIVPSCAFVQLEEGIEGVIPVSEVSDGRINSPDEVLHVGQEVEVKVLQVRARQRRMSLSLKDAAKEQEKREYRQFMSNQRPETVTLGDVFGELLREKEQGEKTDGAPTATEPVPDVAVVDVADVPPSDDRDTAVEETAPPDSADDETASDVSLPQADEDTASEDSSGEVDGEDDISASPS